MGKPVGNLAGGGVKGGFAGAGAGAAAGAGTGALVGTFVWPGVGTGVGAALGAIGGALSGGLTGSGICPIHSAAYGNDSIEVAIARRWRDTQLTQAQMRGYYAYYADLADKMDRDPAYRMRVRQTLIDPLIRYAAHEFGLYYHPMQEQDAQVATAFLHRIAVLGEGLGPIRRKSGEVI